MCRLEKINSLESLGFSRTRNSRYFFLLLMLALWVIQESYLAPHAIPTRQFPGNIAFPGTGERLHAANATTILFGRLLFFKNKLFELV